MFGFKQNANSHHLGESHMYDLKLNPDLQPCAVPLWNLCLATSSVELLFGDADSFIMSFCVHVSLMVE